MKKNFCVMALGVLAMLTAGQVSASNVTYRVEVPAGQILAPPDTILKGADFTVDIYITNPFVTPQDAQPLIQGFSASWRFYSPDSVETMTLRDIGGHSQEPAILMLNGFEQGGGFWTSINALKLESWDGSLPDSFNHTVLSLPIMPPWPGWWSDGTEKLHYQIGLMIDDEGTFCLDSCEFDGSTYDWLWSVGDPLFNGPYCWVINDPTNAIGERESSLLPTEFALDQNYPNPFNLSTVVKFAVPSKSHITLAIYNVLGQRIKTLADEEYTQGYHFEAWDGTTENGSPAASGIYFYKLESNNGMTITRKMLLLK
ncbi:MAG: T9SS type A sorting domain-containing protein [Candidatus Zixiibacteriota bacterium]|nr:MAG: T9SS type A sorting domain-containing protein [candidate division Zixibacteria bacterium]